MSFELPEDISEDDETLLHSILSAVSSLDLCIAYKIVVPPLQPNIFLIKGQLPTDGFEVDMDQMHFIMSASPLRIEKIAVAGPREAYLIKFLAFFVTQSLWNINHSQVFTIFCLFIILFCFMF